MSRPSRAAVLAAVVSPLLALAVAVPSSADAAPTRPTKPPSVTRVVVEDLPRGALPKVDTVVDSTLVHDGRTIALKLPYETYSVVPLGTWRGAPYVGAYDDGGYRFFRVAPDGTMTGIGGGPRDNSDWDPTLVRRTGHVLSGFLQDDGRVYVLVTDIRDGHLVKQLYVKATAQSLGRLARGDRAVVRRWLTPGRDRVAAVTRDGKRELVVSSSRKLRRTTMTVRRTRDHAPLARFVFPTFDRSRDERVWPTLSRFEDDGSFLVVGYTRRPGPEELTPDNAVLVRCRVSGRCERATDTGAAVAVLGYDTVNFSWDSAYVF